MRFSFYEKNGEIKSWNDLKNEFKLEQRLYFKSMLLLDHHLVKSNSFFSIEKLESRELYCIINSSNKPTSQIYFEKEFDSKELDCRVIYILPRKATTKTYLKSFQYKILNNILYLNEKLFVFGLFTTSSFFFCNCFGENITYLFCDCTITQFFGKNYS